MSAMPSPPSGHPVLTAIVVLEGALDEVATVDPVFMSTGDKQTALRSLGRVATRVEELRLRVLATADDVALDTAARDAADWLAQHERLDRGQARRDLRLARALDTRWHRVAAGLTDARVNRAQVEVIVRALDDLPHDLDPSLLAEAEAHLVGLAETFGPRQSRPTSPRSAHPAAPPRPGIT